MEVVNVAPRLLCSGCLLNKICVWLLAAPHSAALLGGRHSKQSCAVHVRLITRCYQREFDVLIV